MKLFNVDSSNKYIFRIQEIKSIEDAGDDFTTQDELNEMLGNAKTNQYFSSVTMRKDLISNELAAWKAKLVNGRKSIVCTDSDLIAALKEYSPRSISDYLSSLRISDYLPGLRRVGDRLCLHEKATKAVTSKSDFSKLVNVVHHTVNKMGKFVFKMSYCNQDKVNSIALFKRMFKWEELTFGAEVSETDKEFMKQIWDNPALFEKENDD